MIKFILLLKTEVFNWSFTNVIYKRAMVSFDPASASIRLSPVSRKFRKWLDQRTFHGNSSTIEQAVSWRMKESRRIPPSRRSAFLRTYKTSESACRPSRLSHSTTAAAALPTTVSPVAFIVNWPSFTLKIPKVSSTKNQGTDIRLRVARRFSRFGESSITFAGYLWLAAAWSAVTMKTIVAKILIVLSLTGTQVLGYPPQGRLSPGMSFFSDVV